VLTVLLQARGTVVVVLARPVLEVKLSSAWVEPLVQGRIVVVNTARSVARLTNEAAALCNSQAAELAKTIVVANASPGGSLADLGTHW
jgi:hypothetical protein